ncbi:hypothetical protein BM607_003075 [Shewanella sp. SACH]|nr:hypothetical protein BM607_003075 [Shewanella sp. SACH]
MFEFTEDKKSLRPKYIGTIKNNAARRMLMLLMIIPTNLLVLSLNTLKFLLYTANAFWKLIVVGTFNLVANMFKAKTWEVWHKPRQVQHEDE